MKKDQAGFGIIEVLLALVVVSVLGVTSWYITQKHHQAVSPSTTVSQASTTSNCSSSSGLATLSGSITEGPTGPVQQAGSPTTATVNDHTVNVENGNAQVVATTKTDSYGKYSVCVHPGQYALTLSPSIGVGGIKNNQVNVISGMNTFNLSVDTGIR